MQFVLTLEKLRDVEKCIHLTIHLNNEHTHMHVWLSSFVDNVLGRKINLIWVDHDALVFTAATHVNWILLIFRFLFCLTMRERLKEINFTCSWNNESFCVCAIVLWIIKMCACTRKTNIIWDFITWHHMEDAWVKALSHFYSLTTQRSCC
jgi:hypothetical protein